LPAIPLRFQPNAEIRIALNLVSPLPEVAEPLGELDAVDFQIGAKPITAGFSQFAACHWLTVFAENFQTLQLTGCNCWLDSFGCFVACYWIAVAGDWGGGFGDVEEG
jgi:hypothetical protein